jgi:hypothetical protein
MTVSARAAATAVASRRREGIDVTGIFLAPVIYVSNATQR